MGLGFVKEPDGLAVDHRPRQHEQDNGAARSQRGGLISRTPEPTRRATRIAAASRRIKRGRLPLATENSKEKTWRLQPACHKDLKRKRGGFNLPAAKTYRETRRLQPACHKDLQRKRGGFNLPTAKTYGRGGGETAYRKQRLTKNLQRDKAAAP